MKQKWKESLFLISIFLAAAFVIYRGLANWDRTSHLYEYDKNSLAAERKVADAIQQEEKEQESKTQVKKEPKKQWERQEKEKNAKQNKDTSEAEKKRKEDGSDTSVSGNDGDTTGTQGQNEGTPAPDPPGNSPLPTFPVSDGEGEDGSVEDPQPTATPKKTAEPTEKPKPSPTPVPSEKPDAIVSLSCEWSEKDRLMYGEDISFEGMKITAKYKSGKTSLLKQGEFVVRGLNNNSVGKHTMTVVSGGAECRVSYTILNYAKSLTYSWPTKDQCYEGEDPADSGELKVYVKMADGTKQQVINYQISGYNNKLYDVAQNFKIAYRDETVNKTFKAEGTCTFHMRIFHVRCYYYNDAAKTDLVGTKTYLGNYDDFSELGVSLRAFQRGDLDDKDTMYDKVKYKLKAVTMEEADENETYIEKSTPYLVKERFFYGVRMTKIYVSAEN